MFYTISSFLLIMFCMHPSHGMQNNVTESTQMTQKNQSYLAQNTQGNTIILKGEVIVGKTEILDKKIKSLSPLFIPSYLRQEIEFAQNCSKITTSEDLANEYFFKSLAPLFAQGKKNVDWKLFEQKTKEELETFFATLNWSQYSSEQDINVFITALDQKTGKELGVIQAITTPKFEQNHIRIGLFGVSSSINDLKIKQLLVSSIFKMFPNAQRLFLHTRSTDTATIELYQSWGFTEFKGTLLHWTDLEYVTNKSDTLQKTAANFVIQN